MNKLYKYEGMDATGHMMQGEIIKPSEEEAMEAIQQLGMFITKISCSESDRLEKYAQGVFIPPIYDYDTRVISMKTFRVTVSALVAIIILLAIAAISNAQELREVPSGISQTVLINHNGTIKAFHRERLDKNWGEWIEWAPRRSDEKSKIFKPRVVGQDATNKLIGKDVLRYLSKRPPVSGHYNFSGNKNYDWRKYAGDKWGTWMQPPPATAYRHAIRTEK